MALSVNRLAAWLSAIMRRTETTHPETNWNTMLAIGEAMSFPPLIASDNDDGQPDAPCPADDPDSAEG
jgi:hypothetical protein